MADEHGLFIDHEQVAAFEEHLGRELDKPVL